MNTFLLIIIGFLLLGIGTWLILFNLRLNYIEKKLKERNRYNSFESFWHESKVNNPSRKDNE